MKQSLRPILLLFAAAIFCPNLLSEELPKTITVHEWKAAAPNPDGWLKSSWRSGTARQILDWSKHPAAEGIETKGLQGALRGEGKDGRAAGLLLYLARFHTREGNLEEALYYQKRLLLVRPVGPWTMEAISEYRGILLQYNRKAGAALEEALPENAERIRKLEREFARSSDLSAYHEKMAEYYFSTLNFEDAKRHIGLALATKTGKRILFKKTQPPTASLRRLLRNIHMLKGDFTAALNESRRLLEEPAASVRENDYVIASFLREASGRVLSPLDVHYRYQEGEGVIPVLAKERGKIIAVRP